MNELSERKQKIVAVIKEKRRLISTLIYIALIAVAVIAVQRAWNYGNLEKEKEALQVSLSKAEKQLDKLAETQEQLANSEKEVILLKESTNALKEQVAGLNAEKEELKNKLEELLNVKETTPVISRTLLKQEISSLSELVTKKYWYRNATQQDEAKEWLWGTTMPFSDIQFVALYDGYIKAGIDLKKVDFNVNQQRKTITITMPKSQIFDHNIPQETINVLQVKNNFFNSVSFNDYNRFISSEKIEMEKTAIGQGILTEADEEAKRIIEAFLKNVPGVDAYTLKFK
jgi:hypothetical protein